MAKVKVGLLSLFSGKTDVRKYLSVDMDDEQKEYFEQEYDVHPDLTEEILKDASIYVNMNLVFEDVEIELEEVE